MFRKKGQSILEYALLMAIIVAVIVAIQLYVKRSVQGKLKTTADQIGEQFTTGETYSAQTIRQTARSEKTLNAIPADSDAWTESKIQTTAEAGAWAQGLGDYTQKSSDYRGSEINVTDYVSGVSGEDATANVGAHAAFDSGSLKDKALFSDAE